MKLTYWVAQMGTCVGSSSAYNIREKTKKRAIEARTEAVAKGSKYGPVHKVTVEYSSAFDLLCYCMGEGGVDENEK